MLKLYHNPISPNSRRVWVALLEKHLEFELVSVDLDGEQFQPQFLELNPFHHIPVLVNNNFKVVESLAILDYLEALHPTPALLPTDAKTLATVRMVELVAVNELIPAARGLLPRSIALTEEDSPKIERSKQQIATVLTFFEEILGDRQYFAGEHFTLAEVVAGTIVPSLPLLGISLSHYQKLSAWSDRLKERPAWVKTEFSLEAIKARMAAMGNRR